MNDPNAPKIRIISDTPETEYMSEPENAISDGEYTADQVDSTPDYKDGDPL